MAESSESNINDIIDNEDDNIKNPPIIESDTENNSYHKICWTVKLKNKDYFNHT